MESEAQEGYVADRTDLGERHPVGCVGGEQARINEPGSCRIADEERRDGELDLVGEPGGQELGVYRAAAFNHELADPARTEVVKHDAEVDRLPKAGYFGDVAEPVP